MSHFQGTIKFGLFCYEIGWQSIVFIMQRQHGCANRIQCASTVPDQALIPIFPTGRRAEIGTIRKVKTKHLILAQFLHKNKELKWAAM